jgi:CrcB protein
MTAGAAAASPRTPLPLGLLVTSAGGAFGAVLRWSLTEASPVVAGRFPWTTLLINVLGSGLLALLPLVAVVRRRPWLGLLLGTGFLGGFTTMSAASVETFALLDRGDVGLGLAYCLGTLVAALAAVLLVDRLTTDEQRRGFETAEGDE